eukprot:TRINITY_DN5995_c0_g1_i2.p1 TRINITY_DN5995_c0_g1~~TRINITY_DN5995_c0_g1_i2.p1  ORF type:complete len:951 (+),score=216.84 TRINITY_DN5995_c0_g1_i2:303-3155(+)
MTSKTTRSLSCSRSSSKPEGKDCKKIEEGEQSSQPVPGVSSTIKQLINQVQINRDAFVKERIMAAQKMIAKDTAYLQSLAESKKKSMLEHDDTSNMLTLRAKNALCKLSGLDATPGDKENVSCLEEASSASSTIIFGSSSGGTSIVPPIKLSRVEKLPRYTSWIFLERNQRMTEDQSVVGRRRIYYDQCGNEALICSDSEEEVPDDEEDKHDFTEGEDFVLSKIIQEYGRSEQVLNALSRHIKAKPPEIELRFAYLMEKETESQRKNCEVSVSTLESKGNICDLPLERDLDAAMDSFDNLFCRRCLVFDCRLHGCSQGLVLPCERQPQWSNSEEDQKPCGSNCYLLESENKGTPSSEKLGKLGCFEDGRSSNVDRGLTMKFSSREGSDADSSCMADKRPMTISIEKDRSMDIDESESSQGESDAETKAMVHEQRSSNIRAKKQTAGGVSKKRSKRISDKDAWTPTTKKQKIGSSSDTDTVGSAESPPSDMNFSSTAEHSDTKSKSKKKKNSKATSAPKEKMNVNPTTKDEAEACGPSKVNKDDGERQSETEKFITSTDKHGDWDVCKETAKGEATIDPSYGNNWKPLEKGLYMKGLEIFGRNSCLIARNLLNGLKTCSEIAKYMSHKCSATPNGGGDASTVRSDGSRRTDCGDLETDLRTRARFWRRRGRVRRLKYTWKSAGYPSIRKRTSDGKGQPCRQYTPCGCQSACGKQCPCLRNGTCCEKFCGCSKGCKNRFRGCHCAKSQCRSRQCPCFAAGRECDPDVCRNCWVSCGDETLGGPPQRGDNYECRNMNMLLKQQQRVLLGRSDVAGWGAFLKNSVTKHDYLGEYTGELISHREADKRGKIYDRENSSFLFNLNNEFVLDAYRKGDKLKFANHSLNPNCYAKVIMVTGDHRVGIFAKEGISAGEELFYDYRYEQDKAPVWAKKPECSGSKREEVSGSHGRAKKIA